MKPGQFRATCKRLREDHKELAERRTRLQILGRPVDDLPDDAFCSETFDNFPDAEAHMKAVHPKLYREQRRNEPKVTGARKRPYGTPAVALDKQAVPPGTRFTYKGHACQVVGAASSTRTRFLVWLPSGTEPDGKGAVRHWELGPDEDDMWTWELTAPTSLVAEAVAACAS